MYGWVAQTYNANLGQGMNKAKQVGLVLDRAIASLRESIEAADSHEIERRLRTSRVARNIIVTLKSALDYGQDEQLARNLDSVYSACLERITLLNTQNDSAYAREVIGLLEPIRDAWHEAGAELSAAKSSSGSHDVKREYDGGAKSGGINLAT